MADQADPIFVNTLQINGFLNGVVNLGFSVAKWRPGVDDKNNVVVVADEKIVADIRMDLATAQAVRAALDRIIEDNTKPAKMDS